MSLKNLKKLAAVAALSLMCASPAVAADLGKAEIETIIRDYIQAHPEEILDAVQSYQDRSTRTKQVEAVKTNRQTIYNDVLTPTAGPDDGDVTLVEFFDYNCGYCKKVAPQVIELMEGDKKLRVLFKDYPILGPTSETAAKWALAAEKQKKYLAFFKGMMDNHSPISEPMLQKLATDIGMDIEQAKKDIAGPEIAAQIQRNRSLAANMNIHGTPAFIVGDDVIPGAVSTQDLREAIDKARAAKKAAK